MQPGSLRALTSDDLCYYAFKAMITFGDADDFKHFLPRLLDLLAESLVGDPLGLNVEILGVKLHYAGFSSWPAPEREAVLGFTHAWWRTLLATFPTRYSAETELCTIAQFVGDPAPYLEIWRQTLIAPALGHLTEMAFSPLRSAWWDSRPAQLRRIEDWLGEADTWAQLVLAADAFRDGAFGDAFEWPGDETLRGLAQAATPPGV